MHLKAFRPMTALTAIPVPKNSAPRQTALPMLPQLHPRLVAGAHTRAPRPREDEDDTLPPPIGRKPRAQGAGAPASPPPPKAHRRRRPASRPNLVNPTGGVLKIIGALSALVGAWHAAPMVQEHLHKTHKRCGKVREDVHIELPDTNAIYREST